MIPAPWLIVIGLYASYQLVLSFYSTYLGPLSRYPGPKSWALTQIPRAISQLSGRLAFKTLELHEKYGPVVRIAPNELSFVSDTAWPDVYGRNDGRPQLKKDPSVVVTPPNGVSGIAFTPDDVAHGRMRRNLSHGFSEKAVRDQEPILQQYADMLIQKLHENCSKGRLDISRWFHLFTFDMIGDLTFGESFHGLERSQQHPWVENLFFFIQSRVKIAGITRVMPIADLVLWCGRKVFKQKEALHRGFVAERLAARLAMKTGTRKDFMTSVERRLDEPTGVSSAELEDTAATLIIAGSETTASAMTGIVFFILKNPNVYRRLVAEIRNAFASEAHITIQSVVGLSYELAVIEESLRLFPPLPAQVRRVTPKQGSVIDGQAVPGDTVVSVPQYACFRSSLNFHQPTAFMPERFLGGEEGQRDRTKAFQPFSCGPRNCMGRALAYLEMRLVLARLLWNFDLELAAECENWLDHLKIYGIWQKDPLYVTLRPVVRG